MKRALLLTAVWTLLVVLAGHTATAGLIFQTRDVANAHNTYVSGINNLGASVGYYNVKSTGLPNVTEAVLWDPQGNYSTFKIAGSTVTEARGINDAGQIVGRFFDGSGDKGFLRNSDGSFIVLDVVGARDTYANGINDLGQVVGFYDVNSNGKDVGSFIRDVDGTYRLFALGGAYQTTAYGMNDAGQTVGNYTLLGGETRGFLRNSDGSYINLDVPGTSLTLPFDINNLGEVVGRVDLLNQSSFIRNADGSYVTFSKPGSTQTQAYGINDSGAIVGIYLDPDEGVALHGFIAMGQLGGGDVVPEPASLAIWTGFGLVGLVAGWRRRRL